MSFPVGPWYIDDLYTFTVVTTVFSTGVATDADGVPTYRVYEDETGTAILNGSMALLDSANTAGFYSEQITLSAANGFEVGKTYSIYVTATVSSVVGATCGGFKVIATPDKTGYALTSAYDFAKGTSAMTESYAANAAAPTPAQALFAIHQMLMDFAISGTSYTVKKLDNSTTAFVVTLNDATNATAAART